MSSTADEEERKKNITFYTCIADIHERYHRSPTSYELRALKELPLEVSLAKNLWDSTPAGRKIHQLLLNSKNGKEVSYLEEAGRLLWFQEGRNPFNSSTIPDFITPLEKLEKQLTLPDHTYQSSAITNDPFAKAVKRTAVKSTRMETQAPTSDSSTRDTSTPKELHLVGYPDSLVKQQEQHFVSSPSPPPQSAVNQALQITSGTRTLPTLLTQSSTSNSDGNSFHNHSHSMTNYQSQATYPNNQLLYASTVRDIPTPYSYQPFEVRRTGSEHHINEQDYGLELESSDEILFYQVSQYNVSDYDMVEERYDRLKPSPSILMRPQPAPQYKSPYKNLNQISKSSEDHLSMAEDSVNRQGSTEIFNEQWDNAFSYNQQPQQYAVQNMYPDPGKFLYFGDGFYPKDVDGPLTYDANAYPPQVATYGTGRSKYGPPKYKDSVSHRSATPNFNACSGQTVPHDTALSEHPSVGSQNQSSQTSQYENIKQKAQKSTNLPPSPATSDAFQKTAINSVSGLYSITAEASVDDDPGQSIQSFDQTQIKGSYPSYPFDNKRLDPSQLAPKQQAPKKNAPTTKTPRKRTPKVKNDHPTARRLLTSEGYHKTIPPSQEILTTPASLSVDSNKPLQSIREDETSPLRTARTPRKKRKVNKIEDGDKGEHMAKDEVKKKARGRPKKNAV